MVHRTRCHHRLDSPASIHNTVFMYSIEFIMGVLSPPNTASRPGYRR